MYLFSLVHILQLELPEQTFDDFWASKSADRRILLCPETSSNGFWGSKIVK